MSISLRAVLDAVRAAPLAAAEYDTARNGLTAADSVSLRCISTALRRCGLMDRAIADVLRRLLAPFAVSLAGVAVLFQETKLMSFIFCTH